MVPQWATRDRVSAKTCRECRRSSDWQRRGLCVVCYSQSSIRERYPRATEHGRGLGRRRGLPATDPTTAAPGSSAKIEVMIGRLERGEELFHSNDPRINL